MVHKNRVILSEAKNPVHATNGILPSFGRQDDKGHGLRRLLLLFLTSSLLLPTIAHAATVGESERLAPPSVSAPASPAAADVREIFRLNDEIKSKQRRLDELQDAIERHRKSIGRAQGQARTLRGQLAVVEDRIAKKRLDIEKVLTESEQVELEIKATRLELEEAKTRLTRRRRLLVALVRELRSTDTEPGLHVVLANTSIGSYFAQRNRLALAQGQLRRLLVEVRTDRETLESTERTLAERQEELDALATKLQEERGQLQDEQDSKERLLATTRSNEQRYQSLVAELKAEVAQVDAEVVALEANVRKQLEAIDSEFGKLGRVAFSWPVPNRGITSYFNDPEYPFRYIFEHPGIDIRAAQGDPIRAAAPGYVARAKDAGFGYSYIMLIHPGGFSTVYGHVSRLDVPEGAYVTRGQVIGGVGGKPGTRGAGRLTTGSHLHLEVRVNGIPANPLQYLL
jgi:murein DD-endopeptidase MepM/ murein hydrolase activator NlpD